MNREMSKKALLVLSLAAVAGVVGYIYYLPLPLRTEEVFTKMLIKPIPKSVRIIEERHVSAMDHAFWSGMPPTSMAFIQFFRAMPPK